jgi:hypothetical protein
MYLKDGLRQIQPDEGDLLHDPLPKRDVTIDDTSEILGGGRPHHHVSYGERGDHTGTITLRSLT